MRLFKKEQVVEATLGARIEAVVDSIPAGQGFFLPDLFKELEILRPGGSQIRKVSAILRNMGFEKEKLWDHEKNVVSWYFWRSDDV